MTFRHETQKMNNDNHILARTEKNTNKNNKQTKKQNSNSMIKNQFASYEAPEVRLCNIHIESGFAASIVIGDIQDAETEDWGTLGNE